MIGRGSSLAGRGGDVAGRGRCRAVWNGQEDDMISSLQAAEVGGLFAFKKLGGTDDIHLLKFVVGHLNRHVILSDLRDFTFQSSFAFGKKAANGERQNEQHSRKSVV